METTTTANTTTPAPTSTPQETESSSTQAAEADVSALEVKIKLLVDLRNRVNELRQVPGHLLRPQSGLSSILPIPQSEQTRLHDEFDRIKSVSEKLKSSEMQEAMSFAKNSEAKDKTGIATYKRRQEQSMQLRFGFFIDIVLASFETDCRFLVAARPHLIHLNPTRHFNQRVYPCSPHGATQLLPSNWRSFRIISDSTTAHTSIVCMFGHTGIEMRLVCPHL